MTRHDHPVTAEPTTPWTDYLVAYGLLVRDGRALVVGNRWRWSDRPDLVWTLPGGRAEPGEVMERALVREMREETGLAVTPAGLLFVTEVLMPATRQRFVSFTFRVDEPDQRDPIPGAADDAVVEARFVPIDQLVETLSLETAKGPLAEYLAAGAPWPGRYYSFVLD